MEAAEILPSGFSCPHCGANSFSKGSDSLDCWFDSGSTHAGVLSSGIFPNLRYPSDIYLEGGDQYRGWFQSSMLTSIAVNGIAPYKIIITNGWTVDGEGKAMHKSLGNMIAPQEIIKDFGADILRLWVTSTDYRVDTRISREIFKQLSDTYLKIRNTARFILGNISDFNPDDSVAYEDMIELDRWALSRLNKLVASVGESYEKYEYHTIHHALHNFCTVDMSNFYLDVIKDRLYCDETDGLLRRSAQTAMYLILDALVRMLAPILAFTSEEIWAIMPHKASADRESVLYNPMPVPVDEFFLSPSRDAAWDKLLRLRDDVNKALEMARSEKVIGKSLDADIILYFSSNAFEFLKEARFGALGSEAADEERLEIDKAFLRTIFIVSNVEIVEGGGEGYEGTEFPGVAVSVAASAAPKCARCWTHDKLVGMHEEHPQLCPRCYTVIKANEF